MPERIGERLYDMAEEMDNDAASKEARRIAMRLMNEWCIQRDKDPSSRKDFNSLLSDDIGSICRGMLEVFDIHLFIRRDGYDTAYISFPQEWKSAYGTSFTKEESIVLLHLYQTFLREMGNVTKAVSAAISVEDLLVILGDNKKYTLSKMKNILYNIAAFNLIDLSDSRRKFNISTRILVLPSIGCYMSDENMEMTLARLEAYKKESGRTQEDAQTEGTAPDSSV